MADLTTAATNLGREASAKARAFAESNPVAKKTKDAVYTAVGFGVIGTQKAAAAVKSVQGSVDTDGVNASVKRGVTDVTETVKRQAAWLDVQLNKSVKALDDVVAPLEQKLPPSVRDVSEKARTMTKKFVTRDGESDVEASAPAAETTDETTDEK